MFRSLIGDEKLSGAQPLSFEAAQGHPSAGLGSQESSWIGALSRPPLSFLHQAARGRPQASALCDDWVSPRKTGFLCEEKALLRQLDDMILVPDTASSNFTQLQCLLNRTADASLFQGTEEVEPEVCQDQRRERSPSRTFLSRVWSTSPEINMASLRTRVPQSRGGGAQWLGSFWGGSGAPAKYLFSDVSHIQDGDTGTGPHSKTIAPALFRWILGEGAGPASYKGEAFNTGALQPVQNVEGPLSAHHHSSLGLPSVTLDQDNGYSSLEEELVQVGILHMLTEPWLSLSEAETLLKVESNQEQEQEDISEEADTLIGEEEENLRLHKDAQGECDSLTLPKCQNKAIAFIMGCPHSDDDDDDDDSQSDGDSSDDDDDDNDDDDGFDSEGSSSLSESSDDESSESEAGSDAEHLWSSLCHSVDPYNPRNFMAPLQTRTQPQTITTQTPPTTPQSSPGSLPGLSSLPASQPPSDSWDDSASASEADEADSLLLWSSFSTCLDPYSPLNFQATLRTREPVQAGTGSRTRDAPRARASPSQKDEPAEQLDGGFREPKQARKTIKKVSERLWLLIQELNWLTFV